MVSGQKGSNAEGLSPSPAEQVEQDWCGWSWWDSEVLPAPGNAVLSRPASQCQAPLSPLVSCSRHQPNAGLWLGLLFHPLSKPWPPAKLSEQLLVHCKLPELAAQTHPALNNTFESTWKMPSQIKGSPSTWVTITILFRVVSISSCLGNRNEGAKNRVSFWPTKVAPLEGDTGGRCFLRVCRLPSRGQNDFCLPARMVSEHFQQLRFERFVLFFIIQSQAYVKNTQLKLGGVEKYTGWFFIEHRSGRTCTRLSTGDTNREGSAWGCCRSSAAARQSSSSGTAGSARGSGRPGASLAHSDTREVCYSTKHALKCTGEH